MASSEIREVPAAAALLHDARFTDDSIQFSPEKREFRLVCWVPARTGRGRYGSAWTWKRVDLVVEGVSDCVIRKDQYISYYELSTIRYSRDAGKLEIMTHYAVSIELIVDRVAIGLEEMADTREQL